MTMTLEIAMRQMREHGLWNQTLLALGDYLIFFFESYFPPLQNEGRTAYLTDLSWALSDLYHGKPLWSGLKCKRRRWASTFSCGTESTWSKGSLSPEPTRLMHIFLEHSNESKASCSFSRSPSFWSSLHSSLKWEALRKPGPHHICRSLTPTYSTTLTFCFHSSNPQKQVTASHSGCFMGGEVNLFNHDYNYVPTLWLSYLFNLWLLITFIIIYLLHDIY